MRTGSFQAAVILSCAAALSSAGFAGQLLRVDIKSDNVNSNNIQPNGGNPNSGYGFPMEGGTLGGNTDSTIGPQSSPVFEGWLINGGQIIDLGTGEVTEDPRANRFDFTSAVSPNLRASIQASGGELLNSASQFGMVPNASTSSAFYFNELYRDYLVVSPPLSATNPTLTLTISDTTGATLAPNTPYNVTVFSYVKPYDPSGNNETTVNSAVYGNTTFHFTDTTAGGLGSNSDLYQFVRPVPNPGPGTNTNSNPDTPVGGILDNYTWSTTLTVFTDAAGQLSLSQAGIREQSINARSNPLGTEDPQRFQLDNPAISGFEVNNDVVRFTGANGGNWSTNTNWAPGPNNAAPAAPNALSAIANFFSAGNQAVTLDANVTVGNLNFNAAAGSGTTINNAGAFTITLDSVKGPNASVAIASRAGTHVVNAGVILKDRSSSNVNSGSSVIFTGDLTTATTLVTERTTNTQQNINLVLRLDKIGGGTLGFRSINGVPQVRVFGGTLQTSGGVSKAPELAINSGATLDLAGTSAWVVDYTGASPLATLEAALVSGRNGGNWQGTGITSSRAAADSRFAIGMTEAAALGATTVPGTTVPLDADSVLFRVTYRGDSSLDGDVDFDDLLKLAQNYGNTGQSWITGDNDYNGTVDFDDLLALAQNYGNALLSGGTVTVFGDFEHDWALAQSMVPEPTSVAAIAAVACCARRRRS